MFLANHGAVCCGETVEEAFFNVYNTVLACETQVRSFYVWQLLAGGKQNGFVFNNTVWRSAWE